MLHLQRTTFDSFTLKDEAPLEPETTKSRQCARSFTLVDSRSNANVEDYLRYRSWQDGTTFSICNNMERTRRNNSLKIPKCTGKSLL